MKKLFKKPVVVILLLLILVGGGFAFTKFGKTSNTEPEAKQKTRISEPVNVIPFAQRPYVKIEPHSDGKNISILVEHLNKPADEVEYELEYQAGTLLQGAFGNIALAKLPAEAKILLGSCSAGGACTFHEDVKGGSLLTRFIGKENYALKTDWRYIENTSREAEHSSKDGKFQLNSSSLAKQGLMIIFNSPGIPEGLKGEVISEAYGISVPGTLSGTTELTIRANEESETAAIWGYDGQKWVEIESSVDGKMISGEADLMELFVVVR